MKILAGILIVAATLATAIEKPVPANPDTPVTPVPDSGVRAMVVEVQRIAAKQPQTARLAANFYRQVADVVSRDESVINTTGNFRDWSISADALMWQKRNLSLPGLGAAKDSAIISAIGAENVALDPAKRTQLVKVLQAIAWALENPLAQGQ